MQISPPPPPLLQNNLPLPPDPRRALATLCAASIIDTNVVCPSWTLALLAEVIFSSLTDEEKK